MYYIFTVNIDSHFDDVPKSRSLISLPKIPQTRTEKVYDDWLVEMSSSSPNLEIKNQTQDQSGAVQQLSTHCEVLVTQLEDAQDEIAYLRSQLASSRMSSKPSTRSRTTTSFSQSKQMNEEIEEGEKEGHDQLYSVSHGAMTVSERVMELKLMFASEDPIVMREGAARIIQRLLVDSSSLW